MRRWWTARMWRGLAVAFLMVMGALAMAMPARAAASSSSPTVSVAMQNGSTFAYGGTQTAAFTVTLTFSAAPTTRYSASVSVKLDTGQTYGSAYSATVTPDQLTYSFLVTSYDPQIPVGPRTATASYTDAPTGATLYSSPVSFAITKGAPSVNCMIQNFTSPMSPGQMLQVAVNASGQNTSVPVDGTYSFKFIGPTTVMVSNLHANSSSVVTVAAPSQIGFYSQVLCIFDGNSSFNSASANIAGQPLLISEKHALGGAEFFSDPTTLIAYQPADVYVVFHAGAGLPTPTGYFNVRVGEASTSEVALGPNGDLLLHLDRLPTLSGVSQVQIGYQGDLHYDAAVFRFPLTNPPIPGGNSGSGGGSQAKATTTASATGTPAATATVGDSAVPTATATGSTTALATQSGNDGMLWLWVALGVLVLGGGAGGAVYLVHRSRRAASVVEATVFDGERPGAGVGGNLDAMQRFGADRRWGDGEW